MEFAAVYNRTTSHESEEKLNQDGENVLNYIKEKGLTLTKSYQDVDKSAFDYTRPAFNEMLKAAASHEFTVLIVPKVYKLTRSIADLNFLIGWFNRHGVIVYFCNMGIEAGPLQDDEAFEGMTSSIVNELIGSSLDDEIEAEDIDIGDCLKDFEVLDSKLVD